ncbi:membrane alanyl aminopeptidase [Aphomia sociella]
MVRRKFKWKLAFFFYLILLNVFTKSFPIDTTIKSTTIADTVFNNIQALELPTIEPSPKNEVTEATKSTVNATVGVVNGTRNVPFRDIREGQQVKQYAIEISVNGNSFDGRAVLFVELDRNTREDPILLHFEDLNIKSVQASVFTAANPIDADFFDDDGILEISPQLIASSYVLFIEYSGQLENGGRGFHLGQYGDNNYLAMNLHPTNARRVFPCMDEPTESSTISFTFNGLNYNHIVSNALLQENSPNQFRALEGPAHRWGMVAHNLENILVPTTNVLVFARAGLFGQDAQASVAINSYFNTLNTWTNKDYFEIILDQDGRMLILVLPDLSKDWYSLSVMGIWEGHVFMEMSHSVKQRSVALIKIAEAMARQWFGYVIYPENWKYQWVISGLGSYAAWDIFRTFQQGITVNDVTLLDANTLFVTEVIQESLLLDGYASAQVLEPEDNLFEEDEIRYYINGLVKVKAPAIFRMLRLILGDEEHDFIQSAAQALLNTRSLETVNSHDFYDSVNSEWMHANNGMFDDIEEYMETWLFNTGYPIVHVGLRQGGVLLTQERFGFSTVNQVNYLVPITFTTSLNPNFEDDNIYPISMMDQTMTLDMALEEESWVLLNIQGQGYYRVNYDNDLWERIIEALDDPDRREEIHPLNRATLVDDALNLARAGKLSYETAFEVVLTMHHETEYAVWKAFVRNMDFLRKRLTALVFDDEDLDPDIYLRMVRRTIGRVENEIGFYPDPQINEPAMVSMTRGLVMDHACRSNYNPCIAAAVDWFYDSNRDEPTVNPDIPHDIRPAVYCTMVREGDENVIEALYARLDIEPTQYERTVILESLACSQDRNFINTLLEETIAVNSPYNLDERSKIFAAVASSGYENTFAAMSFMTLRTNEIRRMYGGPEKLEEMIYVLANNVADADQSSDFRIWINSMNSNLEDSQLAAESYNEMVNEHLAWDNAHMDFVYEWIDENDAPTLAVSLVLLMLTISITLFNH